MKRPLSFLWKSRAGAPGGIAAAAAGPAVRSAARGSARRRWTLRIVVVVAVLLAGGAALALWARYDPLRAEYPDAPFTHFPDDYPAIIGTEDPPPSADVKAYAAYEERRKAMIKYTSEKGILSRATPEEREAMHLAISTDQFVRAREASLAVLKENPNSLPARFALAAVEAFEGNYPRALLQMRSLRRWLYRRGLENPDDEMARDWFTTVLFWEAGFLHALSRSEEELRAYEVVEQIYRPLPVEHVWPLIKLRRFDEARQACQQAETLGQRKGQLMYYRINLAREEGRRQEQYDLGRQAVAADPDNCAFWFGLAEAAWADFRFQESYDAAVKAAGLPVNYRGSPYQVLCTRYIDQGRILEAWDALKKFQEQRRFRDPDTLQFDQDQLDSTAARMLLVLGRCESAVHFARRRVEQPHRVSYSAADSRDDAFSGDFLLLFALRNRMEELREEAAEGAASESAALQLECWALEKRVLRTLGDEDYLLRCLRPPTASAVLPLLPGKVAAEALRRARQQEEHPSAVPYFDAMEAELAWNQGHYEQALATARKALEGLSLDFEQHLRAKVAVVAGDAAGKLGQSDEMLSLFDQALRDCPAVFRMYRIAIPIQVADDGSPLAQALGERILASPRFREDAAGFPVALRTTGRQLTFELFRLRKVRHCSDFVSIEGRPSEVVASARRRFHQCLMSPLLDLKPIDINFLEDCLFAAPPGDRINATIRLLKPR
ncbi:MAG: hypothetical protein ABSG86_26145 [Thermoguttaceae bacterium]|jgi:tetratricopeptide (TPR) repeat protein